MKWLVILNEWIKKYLDSLNGLGNQHMRLRGGMMRFKQQLSRLHTHTHTEGELDYTHREGEAAPDAEIILLM